MPVRFHCLHCPYIYAHESTHSWSTRIHRPRHRRGDSVQRWRHRLDSRKHCPRVVDGPRSGILLLRSLKEEECSFAHLPFGRRHWRGVFRGVYSFRPFVQPPIDGFLLQWFFWGYSLAFSDGANAFIGDLKYFALKGVEGQPSIGSSRVPALVFCIYQCMFAAITYAFPEIRFHQLI